MTLELKKFDMRQINFKRDENKGPVIVLIGRRDTGKSYLVRAREIYRRLKYPNTKGLLVRKTYPELLSNHIELKQISIS